MSVGGGVGIRWRRKRGKKILKDFIFDFVEIEL